MTPEILWPLAAFALGALLAWLVQGWRRSRAVAGVRLETAERLAAAEASAEHERARRVELERLAEEGRRAASELDRQLARSEERVVAAQRLIEEQRTFVERGRRELEQSFQALAASALKGNTDQFLALAEETLKRRESESKAALDERKAAIEALLRPLNEALGRLDERTGKLEQARVDAYSRIDQQVKLLAQATALLEQKTTSLTTALEGSNVKGRWGEIALRNVAELAGMTAHCDFAEQLTLAGGGRPDMTVHLPGGRAIAVDAKAPLAAYLEAAEAKTRNARDAALDRHVRDLRTHVRGLAGRDYAAQLDRDVDLVVMFLPGDPYLSAAFSREPELQVEALRSKVLLATPTTLVALLRTVAIYWQHRSMADNAEAIAATAHELYERAARFAEQLDAVGRGLATAAQAYNRAVGSFDRRLMPMGRRLEEMKVAEQTRRELAAPQPLDETLRRSGG